MKIAMVTPVLGEAGGIGRVAEEYASRLARRGHAVTVFAPSPPLKVRGGGRGYVNGNSTTSPLHYFSLKPLLRYGHGAWVPQLARLLDGFDIVHLHYPFLGGAEAVAHWRAKNKNGRLILTYHMDLLGSGAFRPLFRAYQKTIMPRIVRSADQILVSSLDYAREGDLAPLLPAIRHRLIELPFGVDTEYFILKQPFSNSRELEKGSGTTFLFVGGLNRAHYFKGVPQLLQALSYIFRRPTTSFRPTKNEQGQDSVRTVLVGDGALRPVFEKRARQLGIASMVKFVGRVAADELPRYYQEADCLVLPSLDRSEAFGLVLIEAQACGIPVIASDLPGVRTTLENGKTGLLVQPGDVHDLARALEWMSVHPEERRVMGARARAWVVEKYDWNAIITRLEQIYELSRLS